jgi:hypothetical protein
LIQANNKQFSDVLKTDSANVDFSLVPGATLIRFANTKGVSYSQLNQQDIQQDKRIYALAAQKVASQGKEAVEMAKNLPSTLAFLIENPSELAKLPSAVQQSIKQFAIDLHEGANAISQGLQTNDPKILEAQAQAESSLLANVTTSLIGAGIGKVAVVGGKVVVKTTQEVVRETGKGVSSTLESSAENTAIKTVNQNSEINLKTTMTNDGHSLMIKSVENPNALVRIERDDNKLNVTDIFSRDLPSGSGSDLLSQGLNASGLKHGDTFTITGIINKPTLIAIEAGTNVENSLLGKVAMKAAKKAGFEVSEISFQRIKGKPAISVKVK